MADEFKFDLQRSPTAAPKVAQMIRRAALKAIRAGKAPRTPRKPRPKKSRTRTYKNGLMMQ